MWLTAMSTPNHNTINRFRSDKLTGVLKDVFTQIVQLLISSGHIGLKDINLDNTKIEANANHYPFVWGDTIKTNRYKIAAGLKGLWNYAELEAADELKDKRLSSFAPIDPANVQQIIDELNAALKDKTVDRRVKQKLNKAGKNWPSNAAKYNENERIMAGRNSYSKTGSSAIFMRMKEDHMIGR